MRDSNEMVFSIFTLYQLQRFLVFSPPLLIALFIAWVKHKQVLILGSAPHRRGGVVLFKGGVHDSCEQRQYFGVMMLYFIEPIAGVEQNVTEASCSKSTQEEAQRFILINWLTPRNGQSIRFFPLIFPKSSDRGD